jgi:hypothetical protein
MTTTDKKPGLSFSEFIEAVANKSGVSVSPKGESEVEVRVDLTDGRAQKVYVRSLGIEGGTHILVGFYSPAIKLEDGGELKQAAANMLLRENARISHGAWAIDTVDDGDYLVAFDTQMSHTMDPEEFKVSVETVAKLADEMEKKLGRDLF